VFISARLCSSPFLHPQWENDQLTEQIAALREEQAAAAERFSDGAFLADACRAAGAREGEARATDLGALLARTLSSRRGCYRDGPQRGLVFSCERASTVVKGICLLGVYCLSNCTVPLVNLPNELSVTISSIWAGVTLEYKNHYLSLLEHHWMHVPHWMHVACVTSSCRPPGVYLSTQPACIVMHRYASGFSCRHVAAVQ